MSKGGATWAPKRFWTSVSVVQGPGGHSIHLDARPVRTPAKAALILPTRTMAEAVAQEWEAQTGAVDPAKMPVTRAANSAIDKVTPQQAEVVDMLAAYGETDLLCYRATGPAALVARQAAGWDPLLAWAAAEFGAPLTVVAGVMHVPQPQASLAALKREVARLNPFELTAFHDLVAISGSLIIGLAVIRGYAMPEVLWRLSRIDEDWQADHWGNDEEAGEITALKQAAFHDAHRFFSLCKG